MIDLSHISILDIMPQNLSRDPNVRMMAEPFDVELRKFIALIPDVAIMKRLELREIVDNALLDMLAWQWHVDFYDIGWPVAMKQEAIFHSRDWHSRKGTKQAVEEVIELVTGGVHGEIIEWFEDVPLPPSLSQFQTEPGVRLAYTFYVNFYSEIPSGCIADLLAAVMSTKNTRSWMEFINIIITLPVTVYYHAAGIVTTVTEIIKAKATAAASVDIFAGVYPKLTGTMKFKVV